MENKSIKVSDVISLLDIGNNIQISGIIMSGNGKNYALLLSEDSYSDDIVILKPSKKEWEDIIRQSDLIETEVLAKAKDGTVTKALIRKTTRVIEQGISWSVFRRDGYKCRYCGNDDVPLTVDHLILWEEGGPSIKENLVSACRKCNKTRGNMEYSAWLKSDYYKSVSKTIDDTTRELNAAVLKTIDKIPRRLHRVNR